MLLPNWTARSSSGIGYGEYRKEDSLHLHTDFNQKIRGALRQTIAYYEQREAVSNNEKAAILWTLGRMLNVYHFIANESWKDPARPDWWSEVPPQMYLYAKMNVRRDLWYKILTARTALESETKTTNPGVVAYHIPIITKPTNVSFNAELYSQCYANELRRSMKGWTLKFQFVSLGKWLQSLYDISTERVWDFLDIDRVFLNEHTNSIRMNHRMIQLPYHRYDERQWFFITRHNTENDSFSVRRMRYSFAAYGGVGAVISRIAETYLSGIVSHKTKVTIITGKDIVTAYASAAMHSCMTGNPNRCLKHYANNKRISLAAGFNKDERIAWRALLWDIAADYPIRNPRAHPFIVRWKKEHPNEPLYYLDRQYASDELYLSLHKELLQHTVNIVIASKGDWNAYYDAWKPFVYSKVGTSTPLNILDFNIKGKDTCGSVWGNYIVQGWGSLDELNAMPYMDTFVHYYSDPWGGRWRCRTASQQYSGAYDRQGVRDSWKSALNAQGLMLDPTLLEYFYKLSFPHPNNTSNASFALAREFTPQAASGSGLSDCVVGYDDSLNAIVKSRNAIAYNPKFKMWADNDCRLFNGSAIPSLLKEMIFDDIIDCQITKNSPDVVYAHEGDGVTMPEGLFLRYALINSSGAWQHPSDVKSDYFTPLLPPIEKEYVCLRR